MSRNRDIIHHAMLKRAEVTQTSAKKHHPARRVQHMSSDAAKLCLQSRESVLLLFGSSSVLTMSGQQFNVLIPMVDFCF